MSPTREFEFVEVSDGGTLVMADGHPQSYVHPGDPELLAFEYVQFIAAALDALPSGPLAVTHVGGAGLSVPRYVAHTRPGSTQIVLEPDAELTDAVRKALPLPRQHRIRVRPVDGRSGIGALADGSADAVVVDAFADGRIPAELTTVEWFGELRRVLRSTGIVVVNTADEPNRRHLARMHAGLRAVLPHTAAMATPEIRKGRKYGNTVLVGGAQPLPLQVMGRRAAMTSSLGRLVSGDDLVRTLGSSRPFTDEDAEPSPAPPPLGQWRVR